MGSGVSSSSTMQSDATAQQLREPDTPEDSDAPVRSSMQPLACAILPYASHLRNYPAHLPLASLHSPLWGPEHPTQRCIFAHVHRS